MGRPGELAGEAAGAQERGGGPQEGSLYPSGASLRQALATDDIEAVLTLARLETATQGGRLYDELPTGPLRAEEKRTIESPREGVEALREAFGKQLARVCARPDKLSPAAIRTFMENLQLLERLEERYIPKPKEEKFKGLSNEAADEIRRKILGLDI